jgi:hypothetical protein
MNHAVVVALQFFTSLASAHLVKYVVIVIMYLAPVRLPGGLIGPTKSMAHFSNTCNVNYSAKGISSLLDELSYSLTYITGFVVFLSIFM